VALLCQIGGRDEQPRRCIATLDPGPDQCLGPAEVTGITRRAREAKKGFRALRGAVEAVYIDPVIRRWVIQLVRATRAAEGVAIGASVRGSLALERAARAWALLSGRDYVTPVDVEDLFLSVVMHRIVFTPSFVASAREVGWEAAADRFRERCMEIAPRPGAGLEPEDEVTLAVAQ
jgi:MoxR-like ATPase